MKHSLLISSFVLSAPEIPDKKKKKKNCSGLHFNAAGKTELKTDRALFSHLPASINTQRLLLLESSCDQSSKLVGCSFFFLSQLLFLIVLRSSAVLSVGGVELNRLFPTHCLHCTVANGSRLYIKDVSRGGSFEYKGKLGCPVTLLTT